MIKTENTLESFHALLQHGDIVQCPGCWQYNAFAWQDTNMLSVGSRIVPSDGLADGGELYTEDECLPAWPDVYHISSAGMDSWECGMCHTYWMEDDSPLNAEVYTHNDPNLEDCNE
jgi:hypothetical protein